MNGLSYDTYENKLSLFINFIRENFLDVGKLNN
jgi:hypothetical protein